MYAGWGIRCGTTKRTSRVDPKPSRRIVVELGEIIAPPVLHPAESDDCPFCPLEPPQDFTTFPGSANNSSKLENIMGQPSKLAADQSGARPKEGSQHQQSQSPAQKKPEPIFAQDPHGAYSCEAHHLISGEQALKGHRFERWIVAGDKIEKDTGYSVNNADNGIWAPSIPERYKGGAWGPKSFEEKYEIAKAPMQAGLPQFHKGHHAIRDPQDPEQLKHKTYDAYLKRMLTAMDERMYGWAEKCINCDAGKKPKLRPSVRANQVLDNLSRVARRKISPPASHWHVFLSKYALEFHRPQCKHGQTSE